MLVMARQSLRVSQAFSESSEQSDPQILESTRVYAEGTQFEAKLSVRGTDVRAPTAFARHAPDERPGVQDYDRSAYVSRNRAVLLVQIYAVDARCISSRARDAAPGGRPTPSASRDPHRPTGCACTSTALGRCPSGSTARSRRPSSHRAIGGGLSASSISGRAGTAKIAHLGSTAEEECGGSALRSGELMRKPLR